MRGLRLKYLLLLSLFAPFCYTQSKIDAFFTISDTLNQKRRKAVLITEATAVSGALIGLNQLWYADYDRSKFHTINDNNEWLQMDKVGHAFTSYQMGRAGAMLLRWSGASKKDQLLYGATLGFGFLSAVEVLDGYSKEWGFSWGDIIANAAGTGLYVGQELLWEEQRISLKFSFHNTRYAAMNSDKLGSTFLEQILKDYNGQTYWLSVNLHAFFKDSKFPKWLDVAVGYGGEGMLGGLEVVDNQLLTNTSRYRQYYLSFDVNLDKINPKSKVLKSVFSVFSTIKIPFPALEMSKKGCVFHLFYN